MDQLTPQDVLKDSLTHDSIQKFVYTLYKYMYIISYIYMYVYVHLHTYNLYTHKAYTHTHRLTYMFIQITCSFSIGFW